MADQYLSDNEGSEDERTEEEEEEKALAARDTWFGISNSECEFSTHHERKLIFRWD